MDLAAAPPTYRLLEVGRLLAATPVAARERLDPGGSEEPDGPGNPVEPSRSDVVGGPAWESVVPTFSSVPELTTKRNMTSDSNLEVRLTCRCACYRRCLWRWF